MENTTSSNVILSIDLAIILSIPSISNLNFLNPFLKIKWSPSIEMRPEAEITLKSLWVDTVIQLLAAIIAKFSANHATEEGAARNSEFSERTS